MGHGTTLDRAQTKMLGQMVAHIVTIQFSPKAFDEPNWELKEISDYGLFIVKIIYHIVQNPKL